MRLTCALCGAELSPGNKYRYCSTCREKVGAERQLRNARLRDELKKQGREGENVHPCAVCGAPLPNKRGQATYCPECALKAKAQREEEIRQRVEKERQAMHDAREAMEKEAGGRLAKQWCKGCKYLFRAYSDSYCQYLLVTGHMRGCPQYGCEKKDTGKRRGGKR